MKENRTIRVRTKVNCKKDDITDLSDGRLAVSVRAPAQGGRANERVCELTAKHYAVDANAVHIVSGHHKRFKNIVITR